jgi:general secretion pathway protein L
VLKNVIRDFCKWWFLELHTLVPNRLRRLCLWRRPNLVGVLECAEFALFEIAGSRKRLLLRIGSHPSELSGDLSAARRQIERHRREVTLRLGRELGLRKVLNLPLAARNYLDELLRLEMDRLSPFGADNVYFAHRILHVDAKASGILVEVQIVPRRIVGRALATAECLGLHTRRLEFADAAAGGGLNLLPRQAAERSRMRWLDWALALLAVAFSSVAIAMPLQKHRATAANLERQVAAVANEAEDSLALRQQLDSLTSAVNFIFDHKKATIMVTGLLAELTRLLPDDVHLVQLHINDGEVRMQGYAQSASDLIGTLENSPLFSKAEFRSPITTEPHNGRERFQIAVGIRLEDG